MSFIVVGIDGSAGAQQALEAAVDQAQRVGAQLRVVNVVVLPTMSGYEYGPVDLAAMRAAADQLLTTSVGELESTFDGTVPVEVTCDVRVGHIGSELLRAAKEDGGATMVVAGSRGMGGFKSLLLGSVTTYLAHHLSCPLLIIPSPTD